ncbi:hypothetical protein M5K25_010916 [Dendrobium thyrsiflorum]|uniref:Uncharacterized protein n=1 Tax=Dendrobium thyrsiflorum TaxID=117978 RepID=A0ABD0V1Q8_DENTH
MDDGLDQDPMVPSSRVIMVSGLLSQRSVIGEHMGTGHNHNLVMSFGGKPPGSEDPDHNRLPTMPFGSKSPVRVHMPCPYWKEII